MSGKNPNPSPIPGLEKMCPVTKLKYDEATGLITFDQPAKGGMRHGTRLLVSKDKVVPTAARAILQYTELSPTGPVAVRLINMMRNPECVVQLGSYYLHAITSGGDNSVVSGCVDSDPVQIPITITQEIANAIAIKELNESIMDVSNKLNGVPTLTSIRSLILTTLTEELKSIKSDVEKIAKNPQANQTVQNGTIERLSNEVKELGRRLDDHIKNPPPQPAPAVSRAQTQSSSCKWPTWLLWALIAFFALWLLTLCLSGRSYGCVYGIIIGDENNVSANYITMPAPVVCYTNVEIIAAPAQPAAVPPPPPVSMQTPPPDNRVPVPVGPTTRQVIIQHQAAVPVLVENYSWGWNYGYTWDGPSRRVKNTYINNYRCEDVQRQNCPPGYGHPEGWTRNRDGSPDCGSQQQGQRQRPQHNGGGHNRR